MAFRIRRKAAKRRAVLREVVREIRSKVEDLFDESWNTDAHVEITLTIDECRELVRMSRESK